ncbi:helix-turn-helix transcriptional regulator [Klenkia sp. LSe6-5]|uniref:Helix-turn-helix transcriptional regulator n=1 Tax=Klenkia sesuvii TaxID=3103137 RepID=A0ABU8DZ39_9ACTN
MARKFTQIHLDRRDLLLAKARRVPSQRRKHPEEEWRPYMQALGHRIGELRVRRGLSQQKLASLCGMSDTNLEAMEQGKQSSVRADTRTANPTLDTLWALASALDVSVVDLLAGLDNPPALTREQHRRLRSP